MKIYVNKTPAGSSLDIYTANYIIDDLSDEVANVLVDCGPKTLFGYKTRLYISDVAVDKVVEYIQEIDKVDTQISESLYEDDQKLLQVIYLLEDKGWMVNDKETGYAGTV